MARIVFVAAWAAVLAALAWRGWRRGGLASLRALGQGLGWPAGEATRLPAVDAALLWLAHAGGLGYLWRLSGQGYGQAVALGLASAALLLLPQVPSLLRRQRLDLAALTPLTLPYAIGLAGRLPLLPAGTREALLWPAEVAAVSCVLLAQVQRWWGGPRGGERFRAGALLLAGATGVWVLWEYLGARTHGVTGSDPYCYAQVAVDLARHGDPRHVFSLFPLVRDLGIAWWPIVPVGYYPPAGPHGLAATVWPVGWPAILALGYRLLGETGLYLWAPLFGLASLAALAGLLAELWPEERPGEPTLALAAAVVVLATSREQVLQLLVPMADVPTQFFSLLAVWLALRSARLRSWPQAALAGVALGLAYDIRHTQAFLAPAVALALWRVDGRRGSLVRLLAAGAGACLVAAPDLWYHRVAFGSLWRPESPELNLIGWEHWWSNARRMAGALAAGAEFAWLLPLLAYGAWRLWRERRRAACVLFLWVGLNAGTQFLYGPLRLRDLLSVLPPLAALTGCGVAALVERLQARRFRASLAVAGVVLLLALRTAPLLDWPLREREATFGYLTAGQRRAFDLLGQSIEEQAVVGSSLNSGAIELYTARAAFRPGDWSAEELDRFLAAMARAGRPVYILDDGNEHAAVVARLLDEGRLAPVRVLSVPLYGDRQRLTGTLYRVAH